MSLTLFKIISKPKFLCLLIISIVIFSFTYFLNCVLKVNQYQLMNQKEDSLHRNESKYILLYTDFFKDPYWETGLDHDVGPEVTF